MAKKSNKPPIVILILIYAVLLFAAYNSLSTLALGLWGERVMGTVDSYNSRLDDTNAGENRSRTVSKGYSFTVNGKGYRGYVIYMSDEAWPRLRDGETRTERIRYFAFLPYINKPAMLADLDEMGVAGLLYHLFAPIGCLFLFLLVSGKLKPKKKRKKAGKKTASEIIDTGGNRNMFCHHCGNKLPEKVAFCSSCGETDNNRGTNLQINDAQNLQENTLENQSNLIGFSQRHTHLEILAAGQKNKKFGVRFMLVLLLFPLIGFPIAGLLMEDFPFGESVIIGVGITLIMLIFNLFALRKSQKPIWEGAVVNKYSKERYEHRGSEDSNGRTYTEYTTVITTDAGKKKTIVEKDSGRHMYDYLSVGDRVRFHPMFGTYEKYDKSKHSIIYCNVCSMRNPIVNDHCERCDNLLFK